MQILWGQVLFLAAFSLLVFWAAERRMRQKLA
jgi:hypothetical protein